MNVAFLGTPHFAVPTLEAISAAGHRVADVTPVGEKGHASDTRSMAIGAAAPAVPEPRAAANLTTQPVVPEPKQAGRSHAWIWIGTAVVVAGMGAVAAYHYWPRPKTDVPETPLGNYAF